MKRPFQIAGILLILLLGAGPASAAVSCVLGSSAMGSSCPMGMAGMDADCPMSHALAAGDCSQDCCSRTAPIALLVNAIPVKPKLAVAVPIVATPAVFTAAEGNSRPAVLLGLAASSLPRYILLRVFRI